MPASSVVLDASAAFRAFVDGDAAAREWFRQIEDDELEGAWPELVFVEVAHGSAELHAEQLALLTGPALVIAAERGISADDACYVVLAETLDAPLVTADRRLAAATPNAVLIGA